MNATQQTAPTDDAPQLIRGTPAGVSAPLAARLAAPAQPVTDPWDALVQDLAQNIGDAAMRGDLASMERARRFHLHLVSVRDHWRSGNSSPVRAPKQQAASAAPAAAAEPVA